MTFTLGSTLACRWEQFLFRPHWHRTRHDDEDWHGQHPLQYNIPLQYEAPDLSGPRRHRMNRRRKGRASPQK